MLEAIRIRKAGFSIRMDFDLFFKRYKPIFAAYSKKNDARDLRLVCSEILKCLNEKNALLREMWQIGFTKVFLKEETRAGLERMLGEAMIT